MSAKKYIELVKAATGFLGAYPLVVPVNVGDYFEMGKDGVMIHLGNVFNLPDWKEQVPVDSEVIPGSETHFSHCNRETGGGFDVGLSPLAGVGVKGTVSLAFESESGFVLAYESASRHRVRNVPDAQNMIVRLAQSGWWREKWVLVTEVIAAESATLAVSTSNESNLSLYANAELPDGIQALQLANPELGWAASGWKGSGYSSICKSGTPLYRCIKVRNGLLRGFTSEVLGSEEFNSFFVMDDPLGEK